MPTYFELFSVKAVFFSRELLRIANISIFTVQDFETVLCKGIVLSGNYNAILKRNPLTQVITLFFDSTS